LQSTGNGRRRGPGRRTAHIGFRRARVAPASAPPDGRRWNEIYTSAAIILAGVVLVVGFAFVATRAMNAGDDDKLPDPPPPAALGQVTLPATSPGLIPLGSPTPTPTTTSPSPSPSKTTTRPTTTPPDRGAVSIATGAVPSLVNLTAEGNRDWVHWGQESTFSLERDHNGGFAILEGTPSAPRFRHALSPQRFSWTGGDPVDHSDGTPTGVRTCGAGNGFTISAPAGTSTRTLRLYLGVVSGRGKLQASLTAGSATSSATLEQRGSGFRSVVYTVTYRAPKAAKISLKWVTQAAFGDDCGGVAMEAATLR
jgi:hypothetical protein